VGGGVVDDLGRLSLVARDRAADDGAAASCGIASMMPWISFVLSFFLVTEEELGVELFTASVLLPLSAVLVNLPQGSRGLDTVLAQPLDRVQRAAVLCLLGCLGHLVLVPGPSQHHLQRSLTRLAELSLFSDDPWFSAPFASA
jgi:hypothetical protein